MTRRSTSCTLTRRRSGWPSARSCTTCSTSATSLRTGRRPWWTTRSTSASPACGPSRGTGTSTCSPSGSSAWSSGAARGRTGGGGVCKGVGLGGPVRKGGGQCMAQDLAPLGSYEGRTAGVLRQLPCIAVHAYMPLTHIVEHTQNSAFRHGARAVMPRPSPCAPDAPAQRATRCASIPLHTRAACNLVEGADRATLQRLACSHMYQHGQLHRMTC